MARGLRNKLGELRWALEGTMGGLSGSCSAQLRLLETLEAEIERLDEEVERRLAPLEEAIERLDGIPGVARRVAEDILAEIGADMSKFPSARLASWAKLSPGNYESAGKRRSGYTGRGSPWLSAALVEAAQAAARTKGTYLSHRRIASRRGRKRAIVALAHKMLKVIYHLETGIASWRLLRSAR